MPAQTTAQTIALPDTGGVTATLALAQYDAGSSGCQNITIATGTAITAVTAAKRHIQADLSSPAPLIDITLGQGLGSSLGLTTVLSGATLQTDPNVVFPDGTYNATAQFSLVGSSPITISLIFTATNGKLVITGGEGLPIKFGAGTHLMIFDRGVVPPGFSLATAVPSASPVPSTSPSPIVTPSPVPTPMSTASAGVLGIPPPPVGTVIGTEDYTTLDPCPNGYLYSGYPCSASHTIASAGGSDIKLFGFPAPGDNGKVSYVISGFTAASYTVIGCDAPIQYSGGGLSGSFIVPAFFPADGSNPYANFSGVCKIQLSTVPLNVDATGYGIAIDLFDGSGPVTPPVAGPFPVSTPSPSSGMSSRRHATR